MREQENNSEDEENNNEGEEEEEEEFNPFLTSTSWKISWWVYNIYISML